MLANGTLLGFKEHGSNVQQYEDLPGLKTLPDMGSTPELVENTPVTATSKRYEVGVGDPGSMEYTFVYEGNLPDSTYRKLRSHSSRHTKLDFQELWTDGTKYQYTATPSISFSRGGSGINGVVDLKVTMALCSDITVIDPDETTDVTG